MKTAPMAVECCSTGTVAHSRDWEGEESYYWGPFAELSVKASCLSIQGLTDWLTDFHNNKEGRRGSLRPKVSKAIVEVLCMNGKRKNTVVAHNENYDWFAFFLRWLICLRFAMHVKKADGRMSIGQIGSFPPTPTFIFDSTEMPNVKTYALQWWPLLSTIVDLQVPTSLFASIYSRGSLRISRVSHKTSSNHCLLRLPDGGRKEKVEKGLFLSFFPLSPSLSLGRSRLESHHHPIALQGLLAVTISSFSKLALVF